jgi:hypothetical protein
VLGFIVPVRVCEQHLPIIATAMKWASACAPKNIAWNCCGNSTQNKETVVCPKVFTPRRIALPLLQELGAEANLQAGVQLVAEARLLQHWHAVVELQPPGANVLHLTHSDITRDAGGGGGGAHQTESSGDPDVTQHA